MFVNRPPWGNISSMLLFSLACITHPSLPASDEALIATFQRLHEPIYGVYEIGDDRDALHALLSASFAGDALTRQYVEHFTTQKAMEAEQTSITVTSVLYHDIIVLQRSPGQVRIDADWEVSGTVTHQQHSHTRINRYQAVYTLADQGAGLRIVSTRLRNLERVRQVTTGTLTPLDLLDLGDSSAP